MKHNFYAGPSRLSEYTLKHSAESILDFAGTGLSILGISHRSKEFIAVMDEASAIVKELLDVPAGYSVIFLQGGASLQFSMVPYNLLVKKAAYLNTGSWASKAMKEAPHFGEVVEVASSKDKNYNYIPQGWEANVPNDADYLHYTTNNTIYGTQIHTDPNVNVPLVSDMSSDIFSRPIDVSKYGLIYAGAQKNIGPSGICLAIVKDELLGKTDRYIPTILNYKTHIDNGSMFNTPPTLAVYSSLLSLRWYKNELGGIKVIQKQNIEKAQILYDEIDRNKLFKCTVANEKDRSLMNVCFIMNEEYKDLEKEFLTFAESRDLLGLKGHRSAGGFRASIYNAQRVESIKALIQAMKDFEAKK
jgi:phosphoserine aminotransferase